MEKIRLGNSEVKVSSIVFGAWAIGGWMWGGTDDQLALEALKTGFDEGITSIDTAPVYGLGHSEKVVGKFAKEVGREHVEILTKFGWNWEMPRGKALMKGSWPGGPEKDIYSNAGKESIIYEVKQSLQRLQTDYIDLYQLHRPDPNTPVEEMMEACLQLQQEGKIKAFGVSNMSVDLMIRAEKVMEIAASQSPYSMIYRKIENDILPHCIDHNIGILAYSPLQRGLLTGKITSDYPFGEGDHRAKNKFFKEPNRSKTNEFLQKIKPIADGHGITLAQLVINWTIRRGGVTATLVGARNAEQARENAKSMSFMLSEEELRMINEELGKVEIDHEV
ncbi:MAG: aldo/keto reductase [Ekhidna sp.]|nr:aldo/keto reductase [Ekhidna sp.]MBC6411328.1 aldo/keto reductase [Ekhidna sp.]